MRETMFRKLTKNKQRVFWVLIVVMNAMILYNSLLVQVENQRRVLWNIRMEMLSRSNTNISTDGYRLAKSVQDQCIQNGFYYPFKNIMLHQKYATKNGQLQLCPVWKVGTTFLKRLFLIENNEKYKNLSNPYDIHFSVQFEGEKGKISNHDDTKKFMFVRNPYQRLLSCYVDKLLAPNPIYWRLIGVPAIKVARNDATDISRQYGHDLSFAEFIKYVIAAMGTPPRGFLGKSRRRQGLNRDLHFEQLTVVCKPCHVKYDFVGKMESFNEDSLEMMTQMNLTNVAEFMANGDGSLAAEDAINDTISQPFYPEFKKEYLNCIDEKQALERAWTKLQIRGLIGNQKLNISETDAKGMTYEQFHRIAMEARRISTKEERRQLKHEYFYSMYKTVDIEDLDAISRIYQDDFNLFGYESRPSHLFSRKI